MISFEIGSYLSGWINGISFGTIDIDMLSMMEQLSNGGTNMKAATVTMVMVLLAGALVCLREKSTVEVDENYNDNSHEHRGGPGEPQEEGKQRSEPRKETRMHE